MKIRPARCRISSFILSKDYSSLEVGQRGLGYARVSTMWQIRDGNSLEAQMNALRQAGAELGCVHIKRASKIIASWITEVKIISNLS